MRLFPIAPVSALAVCFIAQPAHAGTFACKGTACTGSFEGSTYMNAHCPAPPEAPHLKGGKENYAHSVELAKAYSDAAAARITCIQDEANADAAALQAAIKAGVQLQVDEAKAKLGALQTSLNNLSQH
ncbi:MAG: hypothetical protein JWO51_4062 [Rhodospirillales bacterium]|nr:hypothetical protein [Rhodospirillales bacterium]